MKNLQTMVAVRRTQRKYGSRAMVVAILAGLVFILAGYKPIGKGLVLGTLFSVINFVLIGETLPMKMGKSRRAAMILSLGSLFARLGLMAVPLVVAVHYNQFNIFAVIPGLLMVQAVILLDHLIGPLTAAGRNQV
jgi:hypothetical protein